MEEKKVKNVINIIKDMNTKDKLRLGIALYLFNSINVWNNTINMLYYDHCILFNELERKLKMEKEN